MHVNRPYFKISLYTKFLYFSKTAWPYSAI